jgi:hypothetical protein
MSVSHVDPKPTLEHAGAEGSRLPDRNRLLCDLDVATEGCRPVRGLSVWDRVHWRTVRRTF